MMGIGAGEHGSFLQGRQASVALRVSDEFYRSTQLSAYINII
jgi:hypothetical protein